MAKLSKKQEYILDFMTLGGKTATVVGNRVSFSGVDRGPASVIHALEKKGLVEQFWPTGTGEYRSYSQFKYYRAVVTPSNTDGVDRSTETLGNVSNE